MFGLIRKNCLCLSSLSVGSQCITEYQIKVRWRLIPGIHEKYSSGFLDRRTFSVEYLLFYIDSVFDRVCGTL